MIPFDRYPDQGRTLLGRVHGANCRHEYGLAFMRKTGETTCAYCGLDFAASYENWLTMALDHVVPVSVCRALGLSMDWQEDCINKVLACAACNSFHNRYKPVEQSDPPTLLEAFLELRDRIFAERRTLIAASHEQERAFYTRVVLPMRPRDPSGDVQGL